MNTMEREILEPTFKLADLAPTLAELSARFALMASEFDRFSKEALTLAIETQRREATNEPISREMFAAMESLARLFTEGGTAEYDTDPIGIKCTEVWSLVMVLSGKFIYRNGDMVDVQADGYDA